jgi:hypothetical protein
LLHADWNELQESLSPGGEAKRSNAPSGVATAPSTAERPTAAAPAPTNTTHQHATVPSTGDGQEEPSTWRQYLAPQDSSVAARRQRRRGSLSFLRELFLMIRQSLQQTDKDDFFSVFCNLEVELVEEQSAPNDDGSLNVTSSPLVAANFLSMLANVLLDPLADATEKGSALEILSGVAMHDPGLIRRHCLECCRVQKQRCEDQSSGASTLVFGRPSSNEKRQVIYLGQSNDLLSALIFLLDVETDAGALLQVSEIMRIILDTDIMGDHGPLSPGLADEIDIPPGGGNHPPHDQHNQPTGSGQPNVEQARFLSFFYDNYVEWLVAPFQFAILHPVRRIPDDFLHSPSGAALAQRILKRFQAGIGPDDEWLRTIPPCTVRKSFTVELLSFCVRAHLSRMKTFLLKSRTMGSVLQLLRSSPYDGMSGDRCLKLAALRFLRSVLAVNDDAYHRHIVQHNLFASVFEVFRTNPVGDNLVSSAVVEMCDYIQAENIRILVEHIVQKHLSGNDDVPSLEDVSSPYVSTLTTLRQTFEANLAKQNEEQGSPGGSRFFTNGFQKASRRLSGKALEDQRKFREMDQEESYFDADDDEGVENSGVLPVADDVIVDEMETAQRLESADLHRTPRMFSLAHAPLLTHLATSMKDGEAP